MKVLALVEGPDHVCCRYRIEAFGWALHERGLLLEAVPLARGVAKRLVQLRAARRAGVVILQRKLLPLWQLAVLRRASRRLVYDVDDLLLARDSYSKKRPESWSRLTRFWATAYAADAVTAGNDYLVGRVADYVGPERVRRMPTCLDPTRYGLAGHDRSGGQAKLVWIGQSSTLVSLDRAAGHLQAVARRVPGVALRVICDRVPALSAPTIEPRRWASHTEAADLAGADIGLNWLPDDDWSRGKCGLRVLQYMAAGLPVVANPVGMNCEMVVDGRTGFLASSPEGWAEAVGRLAADPALRRRMGAEGRRLVERRFSVERWAPCFAELVDQVAHGRFGEPATGGSESFARPEPATPSETAQPVAEQCPSSAG
ncbi:MAG: glycosyltransferase family 4 protein [Pirellulales bacterium]|nr:glycosyltransferase family 4 protein [Pirellulales bacterium]